MPQFLPVIELSALNGSNGFRLNGVAALDRSGFSVASAGDINGDGFADLIIGAPGVDLSGSSLGASYVVFGRTSGFAPVMQLSNLNGANGFRLNGVAYFDYSGRCVASAGDINGDGFDDLIVGADGADTNGNDSGASYVVFGSAADFPSALELSSLDGKNGFRLDGAPGDLSGRSVASAGDVNNDGFADLIIGAIDAGSNGPYAGATYVVFGRPAGFAPTLNLSSLDGTNGFRLDGAAAFDFSGRSVASAGDVNGDGFGDVIIGADGAAPNGSSSGASYVVFGRASDFASVVQLSSLDGTNGFRIEGAAQGDGSGGSVASAGDVNGDGIGDVIVGADRADPNGSDSGASYVIFGRVSGFDPVMQLSSLNGSDGFRLDGVATSDFSGSVALAGDVNGDGFDDLIIGADGADSNEADSGAAYVVFGKASGFDPVFDLSSLDGSNGFRLEGGSAGDFAGSRVAAAGDVNGDGFADLIVGAFGADPKGADSGASYVIFGHQALTAVRRVGTAIANTINGGRCDDTISGLGGDDALIGRAGDDIISGGGGRDILEGRSGNDVLAGGTGRDILIGGSGADVFDYNLLQDSDVRDGGRDRICGFVHLEDKIDVAGIDAVNGGGNHTFTFIGTCAFTGVGQIRAEQVGANTIVEFNTVGASGAEMAIMLVRFTATTLTAGDFIL